MKRRTFLGTSAGAATLASGIKGCGRTTNKPMAVGNDKKLAGKTLQELRDQYIYDLDEYKEFQHRNVVDQEYGGFTLQTEWDGPPLSYEKRAVYEGRGIWTFSFLYKNIDPNPLHLEAVRRSIDFTLRHLPEGDQFFPASFSREGNPGPRGRDLYGDIAIANGLVKYAQLEGNEKYYDIGRDIFLKCVRIYNEPGYNANELTPNGARITGHWYVLIKCATDMLEFRDDPEIKSIVDWCIDSQMNYHYNPYYRLYNERINHDYTRPDNNLANSSGLGSATEVLWATMNEAVRRKDRDLFEENALRFKTTLEVSWDQVYGGVFIRLEDIEENRFALDKAGWGQMANLIGLMAIIEHTGAEWAKEWFDKLHTWIMVKFPLRQHGLPLWQDSTGRKAEFVRNPMGRRAENLHHPRHLMLNLLAVERMMKRRGNTSGIFG